MRREVCKVKFHEKKNFIKDQENQVGPMWTEGIKIFAINIDKILTTGGRRLS